MISIRALNENQIKRSIWLSVTCFLFQFQKKNIYSSKSPFAKLKSIFEINLQWKI